MKRKDDLFDLVHSLSRSEKRYFKLNTATQQGDKQYLKLFDVLQKQQDYDETSIFKTLGKGITTNRYNFLKNYLYNAILTSLQQLYSKTDTGQLKGQIQKVKILYDKGLYNQSRKSLKKAKRISYEFDDYLSLLDIVRMEKDLLAKEKDQSDFQEKSRLLYKKEQMYLHQLNQVIESNYLFANVRYLYNSYGHPRSEKELQAYQEIFNNPLFQLLEEGYSPPHKAKVQLLLSKIIFNMCTYNHEKHHYYANQLLLHYQNHEDKIRQYPNSYLTAISYFLKSCAFLYKKNDFETALGNVKNLETTLSASKKNKSLSANIFFTAYYNELFFHLQNCHIERCLEHLDTIEEGLETYGEQLNDTEKVYLTYLVSLVYFGLGQFDQSLDWFNHILNTFRKDATPHITLRIRLMLLINHFELGHSRLLEPMVVSTYRFLLKKRKMYQYESAVIRFIRKLSAIASESQLSELFNLLLDELLEIIKDPFEYAGCAWFVFWLEGKKSGLSLKEIFETKTPEKVKKSA